MKKTKRGLPDMTYIEDRGLYRKRGTYKGQSYSITAKEPQDVIDKIEEFKKRIDSGILDDGTTLYQYAQQWYPSRTANLKPKSIEVIENALNKHILPTLGNMLIKDIKPLHIDNLMAGLASSSSSLNHKVLLTLKQLFSSAAENDLIVKSPCQNRRAGGEQTKRKIPLTVEQQEMLTTAVQGTRVELFTLLCLYAGLRREESLGILWENIYLDTSAPHLDVRYTVTFDKSGNPTHSEILKSAAAYRSIPLPPQLIDALNRNKETKDSEFLVPAENTGGEMSKNAFRRMWDIAVKCVDFHIEPHQLRHTYITRLCASGMDIKKIQYLAGHATVQMTLNVYTHVTQNQPGELSPDIISAFSRTPTNTPADKPDLKSN